MATRSVIACSLLSIPCIKFAATSIVGEIARVAVAWLAAVVIAALVLILAAPSISVAALGATGFVELICCNIRLAACLSSAIFSTNIGSMTTKSLAIVAAFKRALCSI